MCDGADAGRCVLGLSEHGVADSENLGGASQVHSHRLRRVARLARSRARFGPQRWNEGGARISPPEVTSTEPWTFVAWVADSPHPEAASTTQAITALSDGLPRTCSRLPPHKACQAGWAPALILLAATIAAHLRGNCARQTPHPQG